LHYFMVRLWWQGSAQVYLENTVWQCFWRLFNNVLWTIYAYLRHLESCYCIVRWIKCSRTLGGQSRPVGAEHWQLIGCCGWSKCTLYKYTMIQGAYTMDHSVCIMAWPMMHGSSRGGCWGGGGSDPCSSWVALTAPQQKQNKCNSNDQSDCMLPSFSMAAILQLHSMRNAAVHEKHRLKILLSTSANVKIKYRI
jgi:hypothetical protein